MKKRLWMIACLGLAAAGTLAQVPDYAKVEYRTEKLTDNLFER